MREIYNDIFFNALYETVMNNDIFTILESGSGTGEGEYKGIHSGNKG